MNLVKGAGGLLLMGGKYIIRHPEKVEQVVAAAGRIVHTVMEIKEKIFNSSNNAEYFAQLEEANNILHDKIMEMESKVYQLAEYYDNEFLALEKKNEALVAELDALKKELQDYKAESDNYKKKMQNTRIVAGALIGVGIITAIVLALAS
ncbi:MAG: hypothetical protein IKW53_00150 [Clostridia bacterium]|nr:hypothetical protein [Clostridia bacterium]